MRTIRVVLLLCWVAACAHAPVVTDQPKEPSKPAPVVEAPPPRAEEGAKELVGKVAQLRGLTELHPIKMEFHSSEELRGLLLKHVEEEMKPAEAAAEKARWVAFGFAGPESDPMSLAKKVMGEQVVAFYDIKAKVLHMPQTFSTEVGGKKTDLTRATLAHEIEHGLQDQHFSFPDLSGLPTDDAKMATVSVYEGDATFVMLQFLSEQTKQPLRQTLGNMSQMVGSASDEALLALGGNSQELRAAPPVLRSQLLFPYFGGVRFFGMLYEAGGLELMNKVFKAAPASTEQVLHPEKYVAGEGPISVPEPAAPKGEEVVAHGTLGELDMRTLLQCVGFEKAKVAASGWGGDAYTVSRARDGTLTLQWNTVWDTARDAAEFDAAMLTVKESCWAQQVKAQPENATIKVGPRTSIVFREEDRQVLVIRSGIDGAKFASLMPRPGPTPAPRPPVGDVKLVEPTLTAAAAAPTGRIEGNRWVNESYGLQSSLPSGFKGKTTMPGTLLFLQYTERGTVVTAALSQLPMEDSKKSRKQVLDLFVGQVKGVLGEQAHLNLVSEVTTKIAGDSGTLREFALESKPEVGVRAVAWPSCHGKALFGLLMSWSTAEGQSLADDWMQSLKKTAAEPTACAAVPQE